MFELTRRNGRPVYTCNPFRGMDEFERNFLGFPFGNFFDTKELAEFKTKAQEELAAAKADAETALKAAQDKAAEEIAKIKDEAATAAQAAQEKLQHKNNCKDEFDYNHYIGNSKLSYGN